MKQYISFPGGVEWDGKYIDVGDQNIPKVYRFRVNDFVASKEGTVSLGKPAHFVAGFSIYKGVLIAPNGCGPTSCKFGSNVLWYKYPAGGNYIRKIMKGVDGDKGAVVSPGSP
jgi:hypothetical protein